VKNTFGYGIILGFSFALTQPALGDFRFMAGGGVESSKVDSTKYSGAPFHLELQADFWDTIPGVSGYALGAFGMHQQSQKDNSKFKFNYNQAELGLGVQVGLIPLMRISAEGAYSKNLGGKYKYVLSPSNETKEVDIKKFDYVRMGGRVMLTVFPFVSFGVFGGIYTSGKVQTEGSDSVDYTGNYGGLALAFNL